MNFQQKMVWLAANKLVLGRRRVAGGLLHLGEEGAN